jgi:hypothetical protein
MNVHDRFLGELEDYLDAFDGETPLPGRIRDAIRAELPRTRQASARPGSRRFLEMFSSLSAPARAAVAAVAVVAVVAVGAAVVAPGPPGPAAPVESPTPSPTPTATPTAAPSTASGPTQLSAAPAAPCFPDDPGSTCIEAGTYSFSTLEFPTTVTLDVPEGWWLYDPGFGVQGLLVGPELPIASGWGILLSTVERVSPDPCDANAAPIPADEIATPADMAAIMAAWPGFQARGEPVPVELGGASGLRLELVSTIPDAECAAAQGGADAVAWWASDTSPWDVYPMLTSEPGRFPGHYTILDVDGELVVILTSDYPQSSPFEASQGMTDPQRHAGEHLAELRAMLASVRFGDPDAAP